MRGAKSSPRQTSTVVSTPGEFVIGLLWRDVTLAGFGVEGPVAVPTRWDIAFETVGQKWLGITIPFIADEPQEPVGLTLDPTDQPPSI